MGDDNGAAGATRDLTVPKRGRVDSIVADAWPDVSRSRIQKLIAEGHVTVDGRPVRKSATVVAGALISVFFPIRPLSSAPAAEGIVELYEDDLLAVVDKPAGAVVHDSSGSPTPSLAGWFLNRFPDEAAGFHVDRPGIVHRLDKDTTGVLVVAKCPQAQSLLSAAFRDRRVAKTYIALCDGVPEHPQGLVDAPVGRDPADRTRMAIVRHGRDARTRYSVVAGSGERSLLEVHPETGRTHQIRVHLAALGCPVAGDRTYGRADGLRQLLHAWRIVFPHPDGGTLEVSAPLPADFRLAAEKRGLGRAVVRYCEALPPRRSPD